MSAEGDTVVCRGVIRENTGARGEVSPPSMLVNEKSKCSKLISSELMCSG